MKYCFHIICSNFCCLWMLILGKTWKLSCKWQRISRVECKCAFFMCIWSNQQELKQLLLAHQQLFQGIIFLLLFTAIMLLKLRLLFRVKFGFWSTVSKKIVFENMLVLLQFLWRIFVLESDGRCQIDTELETFYCLLIFRIKSFLMSWTQFSTKSLI